MSRQEQILNLQSYLKGVDKDITMILQNLQWDRSSLSKEQVHLAQCKFNENHKVSKSRLRDHEELCFLKQNCYNSEDVFLPELLDNDSPTVVKFNSKAIKEIVDNAARKDPLFRRGCNSEGVQPLTTERLQSEYTGDERRAIHDVVVSSVRTQKEHDDDFTLLSGGGGGKVADGGKSLLERLAEERDRRRRRAKHRAPPKTRNYSLVLRELVTAQMELLNEMSGNSDAHQSTQNENEVDIVKKEVHESEHERANYYDNEKDVIGSYKSREKYSHDNERGHTRQRYYDKHKKDDHRDGTERRRYYDKHNKDEHDDYNKTESHYDKHYKKENNDSESRGHYDKHRQRDQTPRYQKEDRYKGNTNKEDASNRHTENSRKTGSRRHAEDSYSRESRRRHESTDRSKYKEHKDDKKYENKDGYSHKRKRKCDDEKYEAYPESDRYDSSNRKRDKYDDRHQTEKERSYSKQKSDYKHRDY